MLKRPHYIALGLVVVLTLIIMNLPTQTKAWLKMSIGGLFTPTLGLAGSAREVAARAGDALVPRSELLRQNDALRKENQQLQFRAMQIEQLAQENARLRQLYNWQKTTPWKLKLARVVLR